MAARVTKAAKAPAGKRTPAQIAAGRKWAAAGRAAQKRAGTLGKKWAAAGRAAQAAKRSARKPAAKKAAAPLEASKTARLDFLTGQDIHQYPVCAPAALAEHLAAWTGAVIPDREILRALGRYGLMTMEDWLELAAAEGLWGCRLSTWTRCDPALALPGMICTLQVRSGYHAVVAHPAGALSWGQVMPWPGAPDQAWHLEWGSDERDAA